MFPPYEAVHPESEPQADDDVLSESAPDSPPSLGVPSLTNGLSAVSTSTVLSEPHRSPPLCIYTYARYFACASLRPKDPQHATFASDELYYYLRLSRGRRIVNVPLGVGPSRPSDRLDQWRTIWAYIHSTDAEALQLPTPVWRAVHDLLRFLLWFWPKKWLTVQAAWCKFQEVVCYSTRFDGGPMPDMTSWLINLRSWLRDIAPEVTWDGPLLTWMEIRRAVRLITLHRSYRSVGVQCPDDPWASGRTSEVFPSSSALPDWYASDLWRQSDARQTFTLGVYHREQPVMHVGAEEWKRLRA